MLERMPLNYYALAGLLNFVTSSVLLIFVFSKNPKSRTNQTFSLFAFTVAGWGLCYFLWLNTEKSYLAEFYLRTLMVFVIFIPSTFTHFILTLTKADSNKKIILGNYLISAFLGATAYTKLFASDIGPFLIFPYWLKPRFPFGIHSIHFFANVIYAHFLMIRTIKNRAGVFRNQVLYAFIGTAIGYSGGAINYLTWYRIPIPPFLNPLVSVYVALIGYAIFKYRLMDINIAIGKGLTYLFSLILVCLEMWALLLIINIFFNNIFTTKEFLIILSLTSIIYTTCIILYPKFLGKLETGIREFLYKDKYKYQDRLREVAGNIPTIYDMERLLKYTLDKTADALEANPCSIMLMDDVTKIYSVNYSVGLKEDLAKGITLFPDTEILQKLRWGNRILVREELTEDDPVKERMASIKAEVSIPIVRKDKLLGILNFNHKASGDIYSHEDLSILSDIARFLGMAIENISLSKEKERTVIAKNRLDVTTSMAYGVADRIRNYIVPAFTFFGSFPEMFEKISGKLTPEEKELIMPDFTRGQESIQRTVKLASETAQMCNPQSYKPEKYDPKIIMDLADKLTAELKPNMEGKEIKITKEIIGNPPATYFDKEAVKKVLFHLMQNSIHAIHEVKKGVIAVKVTGPVAKNEKEYLRITVGDTGCGIPKENLDNIFNPFFTTKGTVGGTGLGLTICQFIISQHEGTIGVLNSELDKGTTMYVDLPIIKEPPKPEIDYRDILGQFPARRK